MKFRGFVSGVAAVATSVLVGIIAPPADAATMATEVNASQFVNGVAPVLGNDLLNRTGIGVCYRTFCSTESTATLGVVWSAEHLTADQVNASRGADRESMRFFPDPHIPASDSASDSDYTRTGYDRGHMAPWADSADPDCFTLANILPQNRDNNRHLWAGIEATVRQMALHYGEVYIVSGPIFEGKVNRMRNREVIPTGLYKAIYIPSLHIEAAYITRNAPGNWWLPVPVQRVIDMTHTTPFPALPAEMAQQENNLPFPKVGKRSIQPNDNTIPANVIVGPSPYDPPGTKYDLNGGRANQTSSDGSTASRSGITQDVFRYVESFGRR